MSVLSPTAKGIGPNAAHYEFQPVNPLDRPEIEHTFSLRNDSPTPVTLTHLLPSCSCTTATVTVGAITAYSREDAENLQILPAIAPHQQFTVRVTINPAHLAPGQLIKSISLFVQGETQPAAILQMTGTLLPSLTFDPLFLDYGKAAAGHTSPQTLTATLDARLAPGGRWPVLTSSNPDIQITPLPGATPMTAQSPSGTTG